MTTELYEPGHAPPDLNADRGDDGDDGKPIRWVTVVSFHNPEDAHLARLRLEAHDIPCFIADQYMTGTAWHYALAVRGAKVQVPSDRAADASVALAEEFKSAAAELVSTNGECPRCGSTDRRGGRTSRRVFGLIILIGTAGAYHPLVALVGMAAGVCYIAFTLTSICRECGYEWQAAPRRGFDVLPRRDGGEN